MGGEGIPSEMCDFLGLVDVSASMLCFFCEKSVSDHVIRIFNENPNKRLNFFDLFFDSGL